VQHPEDLKRIRAGSGVPEEWFESKPERLPLREKEAAELLGVVPPNRPRPGQKMRPMSKFEKTKVRAGRAWQGTVGRGTTALSPRRGCSSEPRSSWPASKRRTALLTITQARSKYGLPRVARACLLLSS